MALGAEPGAVVRMVLADPVCLSASASSLESWSVIAFPLGSCPLICARALGPSSLAVAAGTLTLVSLIAAWLPARRASRVAPTVALRD